MIKKLIRLGYTGVLRPIFFQIDPETIHEYAIQTGRILSRNAVAKKIVQFLCSYQHPMLQQKICGISFANPIGLAAGFDKNALLTGILPEVGFGFEEIGSITGEACEGNPKPRLWRLSKSKALVVYYGLKNDGCEKITARLHGEKFRFPIGVSIAKTNCPNTVETEAGIRDYVKAYRTIGGMGEYITVNISCPNAYGGEPFTEEKRLSRLLQAIDAVRIDKPLFFKLSPDLTNKQMEGIMRLAKKHHIAGFICANLTKNRVNPSIKEKNVPSLGGISGKPMEALADAQLEYFYREGKGKFVLMGCGGVFTAEDAYRKIRLGASLIQLITGMIYEGPQAIGEINQGLVKLLKRDGFKNITEAIGTKLR